MPGYDSANQQAADDASSTSSWSLWSLVSFVFRLDSNSVPAGQRYDPVQQQPDDNPSIGSAEQDNQVRNAARDDNMSSGSGSQPSETLINTSTESGFDANQPTDHLSNTEI